MRFTMIPVCFLTAGSRLQCLMIVSQKNKSGNKISVLVSNSFKLQMLSRLTFVSHKLLLLLYMKSVILESKQFPNKTNLKVRIT